MVVEVKIQEYIVERDRRGVSRKGEPKPLMLLDLLLPEWLPLHVVGYARRHASRKYWRKVGRRASEVKKCDGPKEERGRMPKPIAKR
jgi:hypothetical protein